MGRPKRVSVVTLGCSKNLVDSEAILGQLRANGFKAMHACGIENSAGAGRTDFLTAGADIVIVNTCGFIASAKQESINEILRLAQAKKSGRIAKLIVTGCLSERYRKELKSGMPEVDAFFGTHELPGLLRALGADYKRELLGERLLATPRHYAYLKISEGCDRACSFCAIPLMRGRHVSRTMKELAAEARSLARKGVKELILIAQDSTAYGLDLYGKRRLADLLKTLSDVEGIGWIRLHYAFPSGFPRDALAVMAERPNICKYLDMPLQHINDRILKSMKRGLSSAKTMKLIESIRKEIPGITLRSSFIVGYPGETDKEFNELLDFVNEAEFDRLGVFTYSQEEDTTAFKLGDAISRKIKQERADELMVLQEAISLKKNNAIVGKKLKVLIDRKEGDYYTARSEGDSPEIDNEVLIPVSGNKLRLGTFSEIVIKSAESFDLYADLPGKHHHGRK